MVTKAVSMEMKVNSSNRAGQQNNGADGGFSDILGNVSSENRKQPGTSGSSRQDSPQGRSFGTEFRYTEKASARTPDSRDPADAGAKQFGQFKDSRSFSDADAADKIMSEAAEVVTQIVRQTGLIPTREEAADMMLSALKAITAGKDESKDEDISDLLDALMEVFSEMAGTPDTAAVHSTDEALFDEDAVDLIDPDMSEHRNAAAAATAKSPEELAETVGAEETEAEISPDDDAMISEMSFAAEEDFPQESNIAPEIPVGTPIRDIRAAAVRPMPEVAAEEFPVSEEEPEMTIVVSDTIKMLSELIEDAKKELGLTEFSIEHFTGEEAPEMPAIAGNQAAITQKIGRNDRSDELDHIINGTRSDVIGENEEPKTETYDAVRMAEELMSDRMQTEIPADDEPMFPEAMEIRPPEIQTAEQILDRIQNMQGDHTEFTMVLNPEALGRITVKLVAVGEKMSVEITAENPDTRAILASRTESLQNMLKDNGVQLERCQIVSEQEDTRFDQQSYDGSSKNPYSRNDENDQSDNDDQDGGSFYDLLQTI